MIFNRYVFAESHFTRAFSLRVQTLIAAFAFLIGYTDGDGASDTDVWMIEVEEILIAEDSITVVGSARIRTILFTEADGLGHTDKVFAGRPAIHFDSRTDRVTLVIRRRIPIPKPGGAPVPPERVERERTLWKENVTLARALEAGKEIGRIGFYRPHLTIRDNMIESVSGFAYLYPKRSD